MKRQRSNSSGPAGSQSPNSKQGGRKDDKHIVFLRGENKVTYIKPPPKSDNPKHWFSEGQVVTSKPLNFIIPADSAVNMDISTNVTLKHMSIVIDGEGFDEQNKKVTLGSNAAGAKSPNKASSKKSTERCTLEVAVRDLESELNLAKAAKKLSKNATADQKAEEEDRIVSANKFFAMATCAVTVGSSAEPYQPYSHTKLKASLINGIYVLRNTGKYPISVMAMAVDVETQLQ
eukprot:GILI01013473.1.p1 GENE.GILI01013473.1~~GILI01013473.1.p1  ORF type:complete len:232 (+),score=51.14 GILI01013473.1:85-780(+)